MEKAKHSNIIYFSHGGGPLPVLGDRGHDKMVKFMEKLPDLIEKPEAIVVFSAHWEESVPTIIGSPSPDLLYDYYGFPDEAYSLEYEPPGNPGLAEKVKSLFSQAGIKSEITSDRGIDHGVFIPLKMMYPQADIPVLQISLVKGLDPDEHISLGRALRDLAGENILFIGSGFSFHNMGAFLWDGSSPEDPKNGAFQDSLIRICSGDIPYEEKTELLSEWEKLPHARYCHPREEHLLPLQVCFGISEEPARVIFDDYIMGKRAVALHWS